jgi:hypothetical protein
VHVSACIAYGCDCNDTHALLVSASKWSCIRSVHLHVHASIHTPAVTHLRAGVPSGPSLGSQAHQKLLAEAERVHDAHVLSGMQALAAGTLAHLAQFVAVRCVACVPVCLCKCVR